jgi:hypothetical protein
MTNFLEINLILVLVFIFITVLVLSELHYDNKIKNVTTTKCAKLYFNSDSWAQDFFDKIAEEKFNRMVKDENSKD